MRKLALVAAAFILAAWLVPAPASACMGCPGVVVGPPVYAQPVYPYPPVVYAPPAYYYPPPAFYFGSGWDPDYRDIRYNRYFQRTQPPPVIRGYTLR
jgi:hypothetical protein